MTTFQGPGATLRDLLDGYICTMREQAELGGEVPIEVRYFSADESLSTKLTEVFQFPLFRNEHRIVHSSRVERSDAQGLTFQVEGQEVMLHLSEYVQKASGRSGPIS